MMTEDIRQGEEVRDGKIRITPPDADIEKKILEVWDGIAKPLDGFGAFEKLTARIGAIQGSVLPDADHVCVIVLCADNGIVEEGVSQSGQEITRICAENIAGGKSALGPLSKRAGASIRVVDIGMVKDAGKKKEAFPVPADRGGEKDTDAVSYPDTGADRCAERGIDEGIIRGREEAGKEKNESKEGDGRKKRKESGDAGKNPCRDKALNQRPGIWDACIREGTRNFLKGPAMTQRECAAAIGTGIRLVGKAKEEGFSLICTGEMGIGNTTTSAALLCALLGLPPKEAAGRGAGLSDEGLQRKVEVLTRALEKYKADLTDPFRILCDMGGLDIAGLAGLFIGGAMHHIPVIADGIISQTAALVAERLVPGTKAYCIPSHKSAQPSGDILAKDLFAIPPVIDAHLAVGEGTGAVLMAELLQSVLSVYRLSSSFKDYEIAQYVRWYEDR